ncbi:hypothetical protein LTR86_006894 [Recurvomyces mirabilis]|nr:hypothetical protein LTR86_006894 [Recurvomyces mirabilis]
MKAAFTLAALSGSLVAAGDYFGVISARSASPIHLLPMNAGKGRVYLGGTADTFCPDSVASAGGCPPTTGETDFLIGNAATGTLVMGAEVPGGQYVYIDTCGAVKYTVAHSGAIPEGATQTGWSVTQGASFGTLNWEGGLMACNEDNTWFVYGVQTDSPVPDTCLTFDALTSNQTDPDAWQYTSA